MRLRGLAFVALVVAAGAAAAETRAYRSDEIGLALEAIPLYRAAEFPWVLTVESVGGTEVRRLLADGVERRRWETVRSADGRREEREYDGGTLTARRLYGRGGELAQELRFADGASAGRTVFQYIEGQLSRATAYDADGSVASTTEYYLAPSGRLREVRATTPEAGRASAAQVMGSPRAKEAAGAAAPASLAEERTRAGEDSAVTRYDASARLVLREQREEGAVVRRERFRYEGDSSTPASSTTEWPASATVRETTFDRSGGESAERTTTGGALVESVAWQRDADGRPVVKRRTTPGGAEEWRYRYSAVGALAEERYFERGSLVSVTTYGQGDERTVELYEAGEPFMRVYWNGDRRTREEVILDGAVARERTFP